MNVVQKKGIVRTHGQKRMKTSLDEPLHFQALLQSYLMFFLSG